MNNQTEVLRRVTKTVKVYPFIYTVLLLILSPVEAWASLEWAEVIGLLTFTSVPSIWLCWKLSRAVKLCPWHRAQCALAVVPTAIPLSRILIDGAYVALVWLGIAAILVASLVNCYLVFIRPTSQRR